MTLRKLRRVELPAECRFLPSLPSCGHVGKSGSTIFRLGNEGVQIHGNLAENKLLD
jgi:hypothetical protein